ncbi:MAG: M14 family zinc carboxypeptidase [Sandaracinaceae bacterium]
MHPHAHHSPAALFLFSILTVLIGCEQPASREEREPEDLDDTVAASREFRVTPRADLRALGTLEIVYEGPYSVGPGGERIRIYTTERHAEMMREFGLEPLDSVGSGTRASVGATTAGLRSSCFVETSCSLVTDDTFKSYAMIAEELDQIAAEHSAIETYGIGRTYLNGSPNTIRAIQFGPYEPIEKPPTIYVIATQHAREWMAMATALQLSRYLLDVVATGYVNGQDFTGLRDDLNMASLVIVPVANPDGYDHTRNGFRSWRGNRDTVDCDHGVDLNRNHTALHGELADTPVRCAADTTHPGWSAGSEWETQAIESLIAGTLSGHSQEPIAVLDYHAYGNLLIHPAGYKPGTDSIGPRCGLTMADFNCISADHALTRQFFGDTHSNVHVDTVSPGGPFPYFRDSARNILYTASGTLDEHAAHGLSPTLAAAVELPSGCTNFYIECDPNADEIIKEAATDQLRAIARMVSAASSLESTSPSIAYGPQTVGTFASGLWTREFAPASGFDELTARATFTKAVWEHSDTGSLMSSIGGVNRSYESARVGVQYHMYSLTAAAGEFDPLCVPCEIESFNNGMEGIDRGLDCDGCIDLCEPGRMVASNWEMKEGSRGGASDCWWQPIADDGFLLHPGGGAPFGSSTTHCHFTFSVLWGNNGSCDLEVQRQTATNGWETVYSVGYSKPYPSASSTPDDRFSSFVLEANNLLSSGQVPAFRFRSHHAGSGTQVFDPIIFCRGGGLP